MANKAISTLAVGSSVYLNVGGARKEFLVVHQGKPSSMYDESCNGTWLLMKDIYENRQWNSSDYNIYETSTVNTYLNGPFFSRFDSNIQGIIKQVKIPYRKNGGSSGTDQGGANGLSCKVFLLSGPEVGLAGVNYMPNDGAKLDYFNANTGTDPKRIAYLNGSAADWWLRSPNTNGTYYVRSVSSNGIYSGRSASYSLGIRPALILPSTTLVDDSGNVVTVDLTAHKTLVNGTAYTVKGGKCLVNGTVYNILKGRTLIDGTGWDITMPSAITMPVKGDLITMNLDGTDRQYRVLKIVDGTTVEVLGMFTVGKTYFDAGAVNIYTDSDLDIYLNQTYYNRLNSAAKAAIVPKDINQYTYVDSGGYSSDSYMTTFAYSSKTLKTHVGNRSVYAIDIEDVEEYFGGRFTKTDLLNFFYNRTAGSFDPVFLRSASTTSDNQRVTGCYTNWGVTLIQQFNSFDQSYVNPAFQIDLSKIDFTIN